MGLGINENLMKKIKLGLFLLVLFLFFLVLPKAVFAQCPQVAVDCIYPGTSCTWENACTRVEGICQGFAGGCCAAGHVWVFCPDACCDELADPGFDEPAPSCADPAIEFYAYGKNVTSLIANPSFENHGPEEKRRACTGCRDWGCPDSTKTSWWRIRGYGWQGEDDTGARNDCPYQNDGPTDPNECDPPEAQCANRCGPKQGSWQVATRGGDNCEWATNEWCCRQTDEREGWNLSQLVGGLNPSSKYLLLVRSRGKGKGYGGGGASSCPGDDVCWGEGWVESRVSSVQTWGRVGGGDQLHFRIGKKDDTLADTTGFDPLIEFYPDAGGVQTYRASSGFSSTQGQNQWYYKYWDGSSLNNMFWDAYNNRWRSPGGNYAMLWAGGGHPGQSHSANLTWLAPANGRVRVSGKAWDADGGPTSSQQGDGVDVSIRRNSDKLWEESLKTPYKGEVDEESFDSDVYGEFGESWYVKGSYDSGWFGSKADDYWITGFKEFSPDTSSVILALDSKTEKCGNCGDWAPRGQADWLELIELCDDPYTCNHGTADGVVWSVSVLNGTRSEMQLRNVFADGSTSEWGMIANPDGSVANTGWAPYSPLFYWGVNPLGTPKEVEIRFWNQRDQQQVCVTCGGGGLFPGQCPNCTVPTITQEDIGGGKYNARLTWEDVGADFYDIYRCEGAGCTIPQSAPLLRIADDIAWNILGYLDTKGGAGFLAGATVTYEVRPVMAVGCVDDPPQCPERSHTFSLVVLPTATPIPTTTPAPAPEEGSVCTF